MGIIWTLIFGGLVGWVASLIMKTDGQQGILLNIIVGIVGAWIGGWLAGLLGVSATPGFSLSGFLVALAGAIVLIWAVKLLRR